MKKIINRTITLLSSFRVTLVLMVLYALLLGTATWIENVQGTQAAKDRIYHAPYFMVLQGVMVINFLLLSGKHHYLSLKKRRIGFIMTHLAFVLILLGAAVTHFFGKEGLIHLRENEDTDMLLLIGEGNQVTGQEKLPFSIRLDNFELKRYPGSSSPSSYESFVTVQSEEKTYDAHIYMNKVLDISGYRLYQTSYDPDERGSVLAVSHDPVGRSCTYTGYALLFIGLLLSFAGKNTRFQQLCRKLQALHKERILLLAVLLCPFVDTEAQEEWNIVKQHPINEAHARQFGSLPMQAESGRMMPVNTLASEILRKIHKADRIGTFGPDEFLISLMLMPDVWADIPVIAIDNKELTSRYDLSTPYTTFNGLFDRQGNYKLQKELEQIYRKDPGQRSSQEKDLLKLDEQAHIFRMAADGSMLRIFPLPDDPKHTWYAPGSDLSAFEGKDSLFAGRIFDWYLDEVGQALIHGDWNTADEILGMIRTYQDAKATGVGLSPHKIKAEVRYNRLKVFTHCRLGYFILGGLSLIWAIGCLLGNCRWRWGQPLLVSGIVAVFLFHTYGILLRWYIGGYAPWSNSYETMIYVSWTTILAGLLFVRRNQLVFAMSALFAGVILFVAGLNWMDPQITPLVPVLKSPWLMFHVAVIVAAYGFFGLSCLTGMVNLSLMCMTCFRKKIPLLMKRIHELSIINEMMLWIGLALMAIGTFLGAIWANESWGRYWGWDPKETWALITLVVYALVTHIHLLKVRMQEWLFNLLSVLAFSSVLMTYFGVNYFLRGMHSYGQNQDIAHLFVWLLPVLALVFIWSVASWYAMKKMMSPEQLPRQADAESGS